MNRFGKKWFCFRCQQDHDIVRGVIQCSAPKPEPMTPEQIRACLDYVKDHDIKFSADDPA